MSQGIVWVNRDTECAHWVPLGSVRARCGNRIRRSWVAVPRLTLGDVTCRRCDTYAKL